MATNLEIGGAVKRTQQGNADWYYGGDNEAWADLESAKAGVPAAIRPGKTVGVYISGTIIEYWWPTAAAIADSDLIAKTPDLSSKADITYVDLRDATKADTTYVDAQDSAEASTRANADSAEATARAAADTAEVTNRVNGDAATLTSAKAYADGLLVSVFVDCGNYDASTALFPTAGGTGTAGAIKKGNSFEVSVAGTIGGEAFDIGDTIRALIDTPGQTAANWATSAHNTQQATETSRGTAKLATSALAIAGTDDLTMLTPLKGLALITDQKKNYEKSIVLSRGNPYGNEILIYYANAGVINSILGVGVTNILVKTSLGGTYAAPSFPITITTASTFFIQFDFSNVNYLNGNITITGKDN